MYAAIIKDPKDHPTFQIQDGLIWTKNRAKEIVLCVPNAKYGEQSIRGVILEQAHRTVGHYGPQRTADYARHWYWWPKMGQDAVAFCDSCESCQKTKGDTKNLAGKLHNLPIPTAPWESIGMDFLGPFLDAEGYNYLWVIVCRLTGMVQLIPIQTDTTAKELSWIYLREVVNMHGLPASIVSDRDLKFTSIWWRELHRVLGAKLLMSTLFHPQTDGHTKRMNRSIGQILRVIIAPDQLDWYRKLLLVEFAINSSIGESTGFAPFELVYTHMPQFMHKVSPEFVKNKGIQDFIDIAIQNVNDVFDAILQHRVFTKRKADTRRRADPDIKKGDKVYLSTKDLALPKGRAAKLLPKFIGPYLILEATPES